MEINPVAIQSYQQTNQQEKPVSRPVEESKSQAAEQAAASRQTEETSESKLSVKPASGNYADFLTTEEKNALDLLFSRYKDSGKFGPGYNRTSSHEADSGLGSVIDVKV
ncbi:MAG: hypothetical protein KAU36_03085 [candidate division Zixibacteria bacterium]|nr:hypothetical protein [candidate division Zixibacteria bacterium]